MFRRRPRNTMPDPQPFDASTEAFRLHILDVGAAPYSDCVLLDFGDVRVLIDGAHKGNHEPDAKLPVSIPQQIRRLFGTRDDKPLPIDLLVVTHCHNDHIGCLPELVRSGDLRPRWALLADPGHGYPDPFEDDAADPLAGRDATTVELARRVIAGLGEELEPGLPLPDAIAFLADSANVEPRYRGMIATLVANGTQVVRYGKDAVGPLKDEFAAIGLDIVGPTRTHLRKCRDEISGRNRRIAADVVDAVDAVVAVDANRDAAIDMSPDDWEDMLAARVYQLLAADPAIAARDGLRSVGHEDDSLAAMRAGVELPPADSNALLAIDASGTSAARNCQSIVVAFGVGGQSAVISGDMQFADPLTEVREEMGRLRGKLVREPPFRFAWLSHHAAANGTDGALLDEMKDTPLWGMSGGYDGLKHPNPSVLELLEARRGAIDWVRNDRNGLVTLRFRTDGRVEIELNRDRAEQRHAERWGGQRPDPAAEGRRPRRATAGPRAAHPSEDASPAARADCGVVVR